MNRSRLRQLFANYIGKFEYINSPELNETYKWAIVQQYQDVFNLDAPDLAGMLAEVCKISSNLVDSTTQPFYALTIYAREEPETVRGMFRDLFADDGGDLEVRQQKILAFIAKTEELKEKYAPGSWRYTNDQKSVMAYIFFHDPESNYLYKATQAHEFADCAEFLDDWGSGADFKLDVYYRMCDELVEAMRSDHALLETNKSRYEDTEEDLYDDPSLHLLAFDMIYSSQIYHLYNGIEYTHPKTAEKKLYRERVEKAAELKAAYEQALADYQDMEDIRSMILNRLHAGNLVTHKTYGQGKVVVIDGQYITVQFPKMDTPKKFLLLPSFGGGFLKMNTEEDEVFRNNAKLLHSESSIARRLSSAEEAFAQYQQYV